MHEEEQMTKARHSITFRQLFGLNILSLLNLNNTFIDFQKTYLYASGSTYIFSFDENLSYMNYIKYVFNRIVNQKDFFKEYPFIKPISSIYPKEYAMYSPVRFDKVEKPKDKIILKIKIFPNFIPICLQKKIKEETKKYGIDVKFFEVDKKTFRLRHKDDKEHNTILTYKKR